MPTGEPSARYRMPHTADTGAIRTASSTRSLFLWRRSSSSPGSAPILASHAVPAAIRPTPSWERDPETSTVASSPAAAVSDKRSAYLFPLPGVRRGSMTGAIRSSLDVSLGSVEDQVDLDAARPGSRGGH